jgi:hypothetical protein
MLEIYNENLRDLLVDGRHTGGVNKLDILATQASGCNVPGATQVGVAESCCAGWWAQVAAAAFWCRMVATQHRMQAQVLTH